MSLTGSHRGAAKLLQLAAQAIKSRSTQLPLVLNTYQTIFGLPVLFYNMSTNYFMNPIFAENGTMESLDDSQDERDDYTTQHKEEKNRRNKIHHYVDTKCQRMSQLLDDLTLEIKGKLFVIELDFKRRLGSMRKYVRQKVPWIWPSKTREHQRDVKEGNSKQKNNNDGPTHHHNDPHLLPSIGDLDQEMFWDNLRLPKSSECIGEQQAKILSRLAYVKKVSQQLFGNSDGLEENDGSGIASGSSAEQGKSSTRLSAQTEINGLQNEIFGKDSGSPLSTSQSVPLDLSRAKNSRAADELQCLMRGTTSYNMKAVATVSTPSNHFAFMCA